MARPRRVSDEQIVTAMRTAMLAHGATVPLDVVARSLGVSTPALLKRFGSRHALVMASLGLPSEPDWYGTLRAGPDDRPLRVQLAEAVGLMGDFFAEHLPRLMALRAAGVDVAEAYRTDGALPMPLRTVQLLKQWLERAAAKGLLETDLFDTVPADSVATALLGALQARFIFAHFAQAQVSPRSQRAFIQEVTSLFAKALGLPPASPKEK